MKNDHRSKFSNLSNWKKEAWKNQGFNGIWTRDLRGKAPGVGGILPEILGGGVRPASQNPYPIYDQNLRNFLPYL